MTLETELVIEKLQEAAAAVGVGSGPSVLLAVRSAAEDDPRWDSTRVDWLAVAFACAQLAVLHAGLIAGACREA